jgi:hypothetical protein
MSPGFYDVFLCHAPEDLDIARDVERDLSILGLGVWQDTIDALAEENITDRVLSRLENCRYFALLLTSKSTQSRWVTELAPARIRDLESMATVLPLLNENCAVPPALVDASFVDLTSSSNRRSALANALRHPRPK